MSITQSSPDIASISDSFHSDIRNIFNGCRKQHTVGDFEVIDPPKTYIRSDFANHAVSPRVISMVSSYNMLNLVEYGKAEHVSLFSKRESTNAELKQITPSVEKRRNLQEILKRFICYLSDTEGIKLSDTDQRTIIGIKKGNISQEASRFLQPLEYNNDDTVLIDRQLRPYSHLHSTDFEQAQNELNDIVSAIDQLLGAKTWDIIYLFFTPYLHIADVVGCVTFSIPSATPHQADRYINDFESLLSLILAQTDRAATTAKNIYNQNLFYEYRWKEAWHKIQYRVNDHNQGSHVLSRLSFALPHCEGDETHEQLSKRFFDYSRTRQSYLLSLLSSVQIGETKSIDKIIDKFNKNRYSTYYISGVTDLIPKIGLKVNIAELNDVWLSIPNGEIGVHAIYNIIENIVRNTAKHAQIATNDTFCFTIEIDEGTAMLESVTHHPDSSLATREKEIWHTLSSMYAVTIHENIEYSYSEISEIVENINLLLSAPIVDKSTLLLREMGWGLIEMETAAAYLRYLTKDVIDREEYTPYIKLEPKAGWEKMNVPLLKAIAHKRDNGKYNLAFLFFVHKPKFALIITDNAELSAILSQPTYQNYGIEVIPSAKIGFNHPYNHDIVLIDKDIAPKIVDKINKHNALFSRKLIYVSADDFKKSVLDIFANPNNRLTIDTLISVFYYNHQKGNRFTRLLHHELESIGIQPSVIDKDLISYVLSHGKGFYEYTNKQTMHVGGNTKTYADFLDIRHSLTEKYFNQEIAHQWLYTLPIEIVVFDERVQEAADKQFYKPEEGDKIAYRQLYEFTNIRTPDADSLNICIANYTDDTIRKTKEFIETYCNAYFFVFHIEFIEKLIYTHNKTHRNNKFNLKSRGINDFLIYLNDNKVDDFLSKVIILSSEGVPNNLPNNMRWVHLSAISELIIGQERNKYAFTQSLFSARGITN